MMCDEPWIRPLADPAHDPQTQPPSEEEAPHQQHQQQHNTETMMKRVVGGAALVLSLLSSACAAPALVWKMGHSSAVQHSSEDTTPAAIFQEVLSSGVPQDNDLSSVVFLLGRGEKGSERLSELASAGSLPGVAAQYDTAHSIHHHVSGVLNANKVASEAIRARPGHNVVQVSLSEFSSMERLAPTSAEFQVEGNGMVSKTTTTSKVAKKKAKAIANAHILVVTVDSKADPAEIDSAVVSAIENKSIDSVVLSAMRSVDEVKQERENEFRRRQELQEAAGRRVLAAQQQRKQQQHGRRLEDADNEENQNQDGQNNNQDADMAGVVYVSMTPNILAGILFFFLFVVVTQIGIGCMGAIQGQDVYVSKMPTVGREM